MELSNPSLLNCRLLIDNQWIDTAENHEVINPATLNPIGSVASASTELAHRAVESSFRAFKTWKTVKAKKRSELLRRWLTLIHDNIDDLSYLLTLEQGKPLNEARGEILYGASYIEWFAEEAKRVYGDIIPEPSDDKRILCIKQPVGVVACITPWNFPSAMLARKIAPALAAGCTVVCKPALETPLSALALGQLAIDAGIPAGVINIITGRASVIGPVLTDHEHIRKISFTGSTEVGKLLLKRASSTVKKCSMELGGNAPFIVYDDADLDQAIDGLLASKFRNSGQTCVCSNRIFVHSAIHDTFIKKLTEAMSKKLVLGDGTSPDTTNGPLINQAAIDSVTQLVADAQKSGAKLIVGGNTAANGPLFFAPTLLTDVTNQMAIAQSEIFGPVVPVIQFDNDEEVVAWANDTKVGLAAYIYTQNMARMWQVSEALEYGMVGINEGIISNEMAPFGGVKESGMGREGSKYGIEDYLETKYLCVGGLSN